MMDFAIAVLFSDLIAIPKGFRIPFKCARITNRISSVVPNTDQEDASLLLQSEEDIHIPPSPTRLRREHTITDYKRKVVDHREWEAKLKNLRMGIRDLEKAYDKTEDDMKAYNLLDKL